MPKYSIWCEGYVATGENQQADFIGVVEAETFAEACKIAFENLGKDRNMPDMLNSFRINEDGIPVFWGLRLFDNEKDARKTNG